MTPDAQLRADLRGYYDAKGAGAINFRCRHLQDCRSLSPRFTTAQETYVGPRYADGPRLLFLSLDSPTLEADAADRTLQGVRTRTLTWDIRRFHKAHQWRQTNEMAVTLLGQFVPEISIENAVRFFAHANSAKCSVHNPGGRQAPARLFKNCGEFIPGEIRVLRPDILVTQGDHAKRIGQQFLPSNEVRLESVCEKCQARVIRIDAAHQALWLHCYHTGARDGRFREQRDRCWPHYERAVAEFLNGRAETPGGEDPQPPLPPTRPLAAAAHPKSHDEGPSACG